MTQPATPPAAAPGATAAPAAVDQPKKFEGKALVPVGTFAHALEPGNFEQTMNLAKLLATSELVPKDFHGKPASIILAITLGREVGVGWAHSVQNICVINGRPTMWGDLVIGLVMNSTVYEDSWDEWDPKLDGGTAFFYSKRKGKNRVTVRSFSYNEAEKAGLLVKDTYKKYLKRMLYNRARAFALRDDYADILKGLRIREEEEDGFINVTPINGAPTEYAMPRRPEPAPAASTATPTAAAPAETSATKPAGFLVEDVVQDKKSKEWRVLIDNESIPCSEGLAKQAQEFKAAGTRVTYEASDGLLRDLKAVEQ